MKPIAATVLTFAIATALSSSAIAQNQGRDYDNARSDVARVIRVEQVDGGRQSQPREQVLRQECWNERTNRNETGYYRDEQGRLYQGDGRSSNKTARTVIGAIIGGALGNQVGDGRGQTAATIAGAAAGAAIGSKSGRRNDDRFEGYDRYSDNSGVERRCRTVTEVVEGHGGRAPTFRVSYRYGGQDYQALTNYDPGSNIRVVVDVRPQDGNNNYSRD